MIGKYSPTVSRAYAVNQDWFKEVYDDNGWVPTQVINRITRF